jgi:hypothetical protein
MYALFLTSTQIQLTLANQGLIATLHNLHVPLHGANAQGLIVLSLVYLNIAQIICFLQRFRFESTHFEVHMQVLPTLQSYLYRQNYHN